MIKSLKNLLLCTGALLSMGAFASDLQLSHNFIEKEYNLAPKQERTVANIHPVTKTATCRIRTENNAKSTLRILGLTKRFIINGYIINPGDAINLVVSPSSSVEIEVDAHAQAYLSNLSEQTVSILCQTK